jgi:NAD(P)H-dependent FMN reductase
MEEWTMTDQVKLGLIYGSARPGRFCDTVARWTADQIRKTGNFELEVIDPVAHAMKKKSSAESSSQNSLQQQLDTADAFVVVTPEYNHGYPAALKELIDSAGREWHAKPVAFVSYGGVSGGLRAVEQLRQVFAELHAVTIRDSVSFHNAWEQFKGEGVHASPERHANSLSRMLAQLHWWAVALRHARAAKPYGQAA